MSEPYKLLVIDDDPQDCGILFEEDCLGSFVRQNLLSITDKIELSEARLEGPLSRFDGILIDWQLDTRDESGHQVLDIVRKEAPKADNFLWTKSTKVPRAVRPLIHVVGNHEVPLFYKPLDSSDAGKFRRYLGEIRSDIGAKVLAHASRSNDIVLKLSNPLQLEKGESSVAVPVGFTERLVQFAAYETLRAEHFIEPGVLFNRVFSGHGKYGTVVRQREDLVHVCEDGQFFSAEDWPSICRHYTNRIRPTLTKMSKRLFADGLSLPEYEQPFHTNKRRSKTDMPGHALTIAEEHSIQVADSDGHPLKTRRDFWVAQGHVPAESLVGSSFAAEYRNGEATFAEVREVLSRVGLGHYRQAWMLCIDGDWIGNHPGDPVSVVVRLFVASSAIESGDESEDWTSIILQIQEEFGEIEDYLTFEQFVVWDHAKQVANFGLGGVEVMKKLKVFVSYSHKDEKLKERLLEHCAQLKNDGLVSVWHDRELLPADSWDEEILGELKRADLVLLLISSSFLNSVYCYEKELKIALDRHVSGGAKAVPVILRPCDWQSSPLGALNAVPKDAVPVSSRTWKNQDEALSAVVASLRRLINKM